MSKMKAENVERIATVYAESLGIRPFHVEGSAFDGSDFPPIWRVFLSFHESSEEEIGLPHFLVILVDDLSGEASHISTVRLYVE